jgi:hypothetical protein
MPPLARCSGWERRGHGRSATDLHRPVRGSHGSLPGWPRISLNYLAVRDVAPAGGAAPRAVRMRWAGDAPSLVGASRGPEE